MAMDTFMTVKSFGAGSAKANQAVMERIKALESAISVTDEKSEIYGLNKSSADYGNKESSPVFIGRDTFELLKSSIEISGMTGGALNPFLYPVKKSWGFLDREFRCPPAEELEGLYPLTRMDSVRCTDFAAVSPDEISCVCREAEGPSAIVFRKGMQADLGAVGKGYAGDEAVKVLKSFNIESALLDLGGNVQVLGSKTGGDWWNIAVKNPFDGNIAAGLRLSDRAAITSGGYERFFAVGDRKYIHIFDPETLRPVHNDCVSVTVVCESGLKGDALSTALFVMGREEAVEFWKTRRDFDFVIITSDEKIYYSSGLKDSISFYTDMPAVPVE